jgi:hypothetical protein
VFEAAEEEGRITDAKRRENAALHARNLGISSAASDWLSVPGGLRLILRGRLWLFYKFGDGTLWVERYAFETVQRGAYSVTSLSVLVNQLDAWGTHE